MPTEIEAKFLADGPGPLDELAEARRLGSADLGPPATFPEVDRYLDTADGRLAAASWACRLRERPGSVVVSLKGPQEPGSEAWLHRRPELDGPASISLDPGDWPPSEARDLLDRLRAGGRLYERLRLDQRRTERTVLRDGELIGMLSLDVVAVRNAERDGGTLHAVELELRPDASDGAAEELVQLAAELGARRGLHPDGRSKLEHAIERLQLQ